MARAGFYYTPTDDSEDMVNCPYCLIGLDGWEPKDDPLYYPVLCVTNDAGRNIKVEHLLVRSSLDLVDRYPLQTHHHQ